jgi:hypothetical protein
VKIPKPKLQFRTIRSKVKPAPEAVASSSKSAPSSKSLVAENSSRVPKTMFSKMQKAVLLDLMQKAYFAELDPRGMSKPQMAVLLELKATAAENAASTIDSSRRHSRVHFQQTNDVVSTHEKERSRNRHARADDVDDDDDNDNDDTYDTYDKYDKYDGGGGYDNDELGGGAQGRRLRDTYKRRDSYNRKFDVARSKEDRSTKGAPKRRQLPAQ